MTPSDSKLLSGLDAADVHGYECSVNGEPAFPCDCEVPKQVDRLLALAREMDAALTVARNAVREAYCDGASRTFYALKGATPFGSERDEWEAEAEKRYPHAPWAHLLTIRALEEALRAADEWRGMDGDGISDPVRETIRKALGKDVTPGWDDVAREALKGDREKGGERQ